MNRKLYDKATDHSLMEMVKEGDDLAFQQIVRRYKEPLTNYIYRIVNDYDTALDISQEVFIRIYRNSTKSLQQTPPMIRDFTATPAGFDPILRGMPIWPQSEKSGNILHQAMYTR